MKANGATYSKIEIGSLMPEDGLLITGPNQLRLN
jgi:hypothetical protein